MFWCWIVEKIKNRHNKRCGCCEVCFFVRWFGSCEVRSNAGLSFDARIEIAAKANQYPAPGNMCDRTHCWCSWPLRKKNKTCGLYSMAKASMLENCKYFAVESEPKSYCENCKTEIGGSFVACCSKFQTNLSFQKCAAIPNPLASSLSWGSASEFI